MNENEQVEDQGNAVSTAPEPDSRLTVARNAAPPDALTDFGKIDIGIERATEIANKLKGVIVERQLAVTMGRKEHLLIEAWVTCGMMVGISPKTEWTQEVRNPTTGELEGYKARVQALRMATGAVIGAAESSCHFDERVKKRGTDELIERWMEHGRPNRHACLSMAQTRSTSKALAQALRWIPVLAGYSGTPYEEMPRDGVPESGGNGNQQRDKQTSGRSAPTGRSGNSEKISEPMAKRAVAIARGRGQEIKPEVHGFDVIADMLNLGSMEVQPDGVRYPDLLAHIVKVLPPARYEGFCNAISLYEGPDKPLAKQGGGGESGGASADDRPLEADNPGAPPAGPDVGDGGDTTGPPEGSEELVPVIVDGETKYIPIRQSVEHVDEQSGEIYYTEVPF